MTLTLIRKDLSPQRVDSRLDLFGIVPDRLLGLDIASIEQLKVRIDQLDVPLPDQFDIVDGPRDALVLKGDLMKADRVGGGLRMGTLIVESDVGLSLAEDMRQGELILQGSAGDFACSQLRGGRVRIQGDVGDYCAAARPGLRTGMRGGTCHIAGNAGRFLALRMRRGTLVASGDVAEASACSMIAGSVIIQGRVAAPIGVGMRRGTIVLIQSEPPPLPVGFTPLEPVKLSYLPLLLNEAEPELNKKCPIDSEQGQWLRALGDRASGGLGEVLWFRPNDDELLQ